jgi:Dolichyl-phosphate-mannose-protein mannosyltransferase
MLRSLLALTWAGVAGYLAFRDWDPHTFSYLSLFFWGAPMFPHDIGAAFYKLFTHGLRELGYMVVLLLAAAGAGRMLLALQRPVAHLNRFVLSLALGLAVLSWGTYALGLLGLYNATGICIAATALGFFACFGLRYVRAIFKNRTRTEVSRNPITLLCVLAPLAIFLLAKALWPVVQVDAITYHLGLPNYYIQEGGLAYIPHDMCSAYPPFMEMLYTLAMLVAGQKSAQFTSVLILLMTTLTVYDFAKAWLDARYALLCAAACALTPCFMDSALLCSNDLALAYYTLTATYCFLLWRKHRQTNILILTGIMAGICLSIKYTAFFYIPFFIIAGWTYEAHPNRLGLRRSSACMLLCFVIAGAVCLPWMIKNLADTGNPVYPALFSVLGGEDMNAEMYATAGQWGASVGRQPILKTMLQTIRSFFLYSTTCFEKMGLLGNTGLLPLFFFPLLLLIRKRPPAISALLFCATVIVITLGSSFALPRYYYPAILLLLILAAFAAGSLYSQSPRILKPFIAGVIALCLLLNTGMGFHQANRRTKTYGFDFIHQSDELYLNRHMIGNPEAFLDSYPINIYINRYLGPEACVLIIGDVQHLYLQRRHRYTYLSATTPYRPFSLYAEDHRAAARSLLQSGITHIQYNPRELRRLQDVGAIAWRAEDTHLIESFLSSSQVRTIYSFAFHGNKATLYKIVEQP